ncbi:MAG: hypothetical protein U0804_10820 [Gemmataceae bacterium]
MHRLIRSPAAVAALVFAAVYAVGADTAPKPVFVGYSVHVSPGSTFDVSGYLARNRPGATEREVPFFKQTTHMRGDDVHHRVTSVHDEWAGLNGPARVALGGAAVGVVAGWLCWWLQNRRPSPAAGPDRPGPDRPVLPLPIDVLGAAVAVGAFVLVVQLTDSLVLATTAGLGVGVGALSWRALVGLAVVSGAVLAALGLTFLLADSLAVAVFVGAFVGVRLLTTPLPARPVGGMARPAADAPDGPGGPPVWHRLAGAACRLLLVGMAVGLVAVVVIAGCLVVAESPEAVARRVRAGMTRDEVAEATGCDPSTPEFGPEPASAPVGRPVGKPGADGPPAVVPPTPPRREPVEVYEPFGCRLVVEYRPYVGVDRAVGVTAHPSPAREWASAVLPVAGAGAGLVAILWWCRRAVVKSPGLRSGYNDGSDPPQDGHGS